MIADRRGAGVDDADRAHRQAARAYPWAGNTRSGRARTPTPSPPGYCARCRSSKADLPPTAIGKDYAGDRFIATAPSGSGFQLSLFGLLGVTASGVEGLELNLLGLTFGVNPFEPAVKLPLVGRLGPTRAFLTDR